MATKEHKRSKSDSTSKSVKPETDSSAEHASATTPSKRKASVDEIEVNLEAPEPPSKRAKRALKKGRSVGKTRQDKDDADLTKDDTGEKDDKQERGEHGVWIGNMPWTVTQDELKEWLVQNSGGVLTPESITRVKMPLTKDSRMDKMRNKGFAYVDFTDLGGKLSAIALSETDLNGRKLLIKDSTSFEGRPKKEPEPEPVVAGPNGQDVDQKKAFRQENNASRKIFVGNMSFQTTEEDVRRQFEKCGEIEFLKVATFEDSGKCKGFGWVRFKEPDAAAWAVKGFVKVKEEIETEDDFKDEENNDENEDSDKKERQYKTRKWWVNRMFGRELKIELAEDDQLRYRKRFGKDAPKDADGKTIVRPKKSEGKSSNGDDGLKPMKESTNIDVARLKGTVVKPTGTKVTFD